MGTGFKYSGTDLKEEVTVGNGTFKIPIACPICVGHEKFLRWYHYPSVLHWLNLQRHHRRNHTYGNDALVNYAYDNLDRITSETYNDGTQYKYTYDGLLHSIKSIKDSSTSQEYVYGYDTLGRLINFTEKASGTVFQYGSHKYDKGKPIDEICVYNPECLFARKVRAAQI